MSSQQDLIKPIYAEAFISNIFAGHPADEHILIARQLTANSGGFTHSCWGGKAVRSWMRPASIGALYFNVSTVRQPQEEGGALAQAYARLYRCICPRP